MRIAITRERDGMARGCSRMMDDQPARKRIEGLHCFIASLLQVPPSETGPVQKLSMARVSIKAGDQTARTDQNRPVILSM